MNLNSKALHQQSPEILNDYFPSIFPIPGISYERNKKAITYFPNVFFFALCLPSKLCLLSTFFYPSMSVRKLFFMYVCVLIRVQLGMAAVAVSPAAAAAIFTEKEVQRGRQAASQQSQPLHRAAASPVFKKGRRRRRGMHFSLSQAIHSFSFFFFISSPS